jgi:hypothetical protein
MNTPDPDHDFEQWLRRATPRPPPAQWKAEILSEAHARSVTKQPAPIAPRWLLTGWGLAWAATLVLWIGTPAPEGGATRVIATPDMNRVIKQRHEILASLLAANTP